MGFEPSPEDLKHFDPSIFKSKAEIKTLLAYYHSRKCKGLADYLNFQALTKTPQDLTSLINFCTGREMMKSQLPCLEEWNQVDWMTKKNFTAKERRDLLKKMTSCLSSNYFVDRNVIDHYMELIEERVGLSSKLLPTLYNNLSQLPKETNDDYLDLEINESLDDVDKVIQEKGLERQANISNYKRNLSFKTLQQFPLQYVVATNENLGQAAMRCIKFNSELPRIHLFSNEEILDRTTIHPQLTCISLFEIEEMNKLQ